MRTANKNPAWYNEPLRLSTKEQADPIAAMDDVFTNFHLGDIREELWEWLVTAISKDESIYDRGVKRSNLLNFYENLEILVEAAWVLSMEEKKKKD